MGVVDALLGARTARRPDTGRVAAALRAEPAAGLAQLQRLLESAALRESPAESRLAALESLRGEWRGAIEPMLAALRDRPIPLEADALASLHRAGLALRALREAYRATHDALRDGRPEGAPPPRALLALARALDAQSRLLVAACRLRVALPREDWDEACRLALPLRAASALDEAFPDPTSDARVETPRAAFVLPLLLRLLEPLGLPAAQLDAAAALARRGARGTGLRIDVDGMPHVCAEGPSLRLSAGHSVRLDTRSTTARLRRIRERLAAGASPASIGLRTVLSAAALDALLERLESVWGPYHVPTPLRRAPVPAALMHVGLPRRARPDAAASRSPADGYDAPGARPAAPGGSPYVYGRLAAGAAAGVAAGVAGGREPGAAPSASELAASRDAAVRGVLNGTAAPVEWRGEDERRAVFSRVEATPRLRLGQLVAVLPVRALERAGRPGAPRVVSAPLPLRLGRVATLAHTGVADGREPFAHDVGVAFWPGAALPVRVRFDGSSAFEDAWWIPEDPAGGPASLVVRRDRFEGPCDVVVREASRDVELRVRGLIERGPDHDRLEVTPIG